MAATTDPTRSNIAHLFRRAGFGAHADEIDQAAKAGYAATVDSLLAGLTGHDASGDAVPLPDLTRPQATTPAPTDPLAKMAAQRARRAAENQQLLALQRWWLDRMISTSTPLREKLTLIWHGHFATAFQKVQFADFMYRQNQLFRTMGSGNFEALVQAVAKDPAMMLWLDTQTSVVGHPNENFARELMELFTLGLAPQGPANYSETDVKEAARAFTGWSLVPATGQFVLRPGRHDSGVKTVLGQSGNFDGTDIVHLVTHQPASSLFVVAKLWSHFAYPVPTTDPIVAALAVDYAKDLNIASLLRAIFLHPAFTSTTAKQGLIKQPIEWVAGMARAFGVNADLQAGPATAVPAPSAGAGAGQGGAGAGQGAVGVGGAGAGAGQGAVGVGGAGAGQGAVGAGGAGARAGQGAAGGTRSPLSGVLTLLAQEPFNPPNVGGWPQNTYWLNTATSLLRLQFGLNFGQRVDLSWLTALPVNQRPGALATRLSVDGWGQTTAAALNHVASYPAALVALAVAAPEYVLN